jgi:NDP-sugar pyrophosphorylase family protein
MTNINPNNYEGATATVVGKAGGAPEAVFDGSTTRLSVAVSQGYKKDGEWVDTGTTWYTVQASTDWAEQNWPDIEAGDKVRVDGAKQETRLYLKDNGEPGLEVKLTYGSLKVVERKRDREPARSGNKPF